MMSIGIGDDRVVVLMETLKVVGGSVVDAKSERKGKGQELRENKRGCAACRITRKIKVLESARSNNK